MIFFELKRDGFTVCSNIDDTSREFCLVGKGVYRMSKGYEINLWATGNDSKLLGSAKHLKTTVEAYSQIIPIIEKIEEGKNSQYNIFAHNLITTHSRLQDAVENIVTEEVFAKEMDHDGQIRLVQKLLGEDIQGAAGVFLSISKRIVDLQAQIEGFKILSGDAELDVGNHNILKVIQNIVHPFYEELAENSVSIKWHINPDEAESNKVRTDYKVLNVILHHLLTNAVKYTKPYSNIDINYNYKTKELSFSMISIRIERDEISNIFELSYCGRNVPLTIAGEGVGMFMAKKAANLLGAELRVSPDYSARNEEINEIKYIPNKFIIRL